MPDIGIQLYTLRSVDLTVPELIERVGEAGYEGVEFAYRVHEEHPDVIRDALEDNGVAPLGAHVGIDDLEEDFDDLVAFYSAIGCSELVVPWLGAEHFETDEAVEAAVERLNEMAWRLEEHDMTLHYHNHHHEYVDRNGHTAFDRFVEASSFPIELDAGLARLGGDDPIDRIHSLGDRCRLLHVKDVDEAAGESVPLGAGDLDAAGVVEAFTGVGGEWLIYEYEGEDPLETLAASAEQLRDRR